MGIHSIWSNHAGILSRFVTVLTDDTTLNAAQNKMRLNHLMMGKNI